jgi:hypothetical protein
MLKIVYRNLKSENSQLKIIPRNLNEIVRSWIRHLDNGQWSSEKSTSYVAFARLILKGWQIDIDYRDTIRQFEPLCSTNTYSRSPPTHSVSTLLKLQKLITAPSDNFGNFLSRLAYALSSTLLWALVGQRELKRNIKQVVFVNNLSIWLYVEPLF